MKSSLRAAVAAATLTAAIGATAPAMAETVIAGFTNGCFGRGCTPGDTATTGPNPLTYRNSTFLALSDDEDGFFTIGNEADTPNLDNLGSFRLGTNPGRIDRRTPFRLEVRFTAPEGLSPESETFEAELRGSVTRRRGGGVFVNFNNNPRTFNFEGGTLTFAVNDVSVTPGRRAAVTGQGEVTIVPGPIAGAGLPALMALGGFVWLRRRKAAAVA